MGERPADVARALGMRRQALGNRLARDRRRDPRRPALSAPTGIPMNAEASRWHAWQLAHGGKVWWLHERKREPGPDPEALTTDRLVDQRRRAHVAETPARPGPDPRTPMPRPHRLPRMPEGRRRRQGLGRSGPTDRDCGHHSRRTVR